jgi:hypothetical protein
MTASTQALLRDRAALTQHHAQCQASLAGWQGRWHRVAQAVERAHGGIAPRFLTTVAAASAAMALLLAVCA